MMNIFFSKHRILIIVVLVVLLLVELSDAKRKPNRNRQKNKNKNKNFRGRRNPSNECPRNRTRIPTSNNWSCPTPNLSCPASFADPPLLIISLDGFRADYLARRLTPTLQKITTCGVKAKYMRPIFPTTTFPNHYSIVTGQYAETHGIIDNNMYDKNLRQKLDIEVNGNNSIWWKSEPLWITAEKNNKKTGTFYWLGSEAQINGVRPTYYRTYNPSRHTWSCRVDTILDWLDLPANQRPAFMTLYFNQPDNVGHKFGPNSSNLNNTLRQVDQALHKLMIGLAHKRLLSCVNIMIVSDHGMSERSCSRVIPLDRFINLTDVNYVAGAAARIRPKGQVNEARINDFVSRLRCKTDKLLVAKKEELPKRFHYVDHYRIEPIILGPYPGYEVKSTTKDRNSLIVCEGGAHGYDNMATDMRAIFLAMGPSFKRNITVEPFMNIELYNLMAELIKVSPLPNNGTTGSLHHLLRNPPNDTRRVAPVNPQTCTGGASSAYQPLATSCNCTVATSAPQINSSLNNLPWTSPSSDVCMILNRNYVSAYRSHLKMVAWVSYTQHNQAQNGSQFTCWHTDSRIPHDATTNCIQPNGTGNEQLADKPLYPPSLALNDSSVWLNSNSAPMYSGFYEGVLTPLNRLLSEWALRLGPINIIIGPAFDTRHNGVFPGVNSIQASKRRPSNVAVPTHYFAVLTRCKTRNTTLSACDASYLDAIAFLLPHRPQKENCLPARDYLTYHSSTVKEVETLTGLHFYPTLPYNEAIRLRTKLQEHTLWN